MNNQDKIKSNHDFVRALHDAVHYDKMKKTNDYLAKRRAIAKQKREKKNADNSKINQAI
tara:strand:- start:342 stop:518 length:177 start_codon:yes stop_codon:yes gene_type:complete